MEWKFELDNALTVQCITAISAITGLTFVSTTLKSEKLALANEIVLLAIIFVLFGQRPAPKK